MRDGEHKGKKVEVVPNSSITYRVGPDEDDMLYISPSHDSVQRFVEPKYNYLRYYSPQTMQIVAVFLGHEVLADLMDEGIPASEIRDKISEGEMEAYEHWCGRMAVAATTMMNCIEVEEAMDEQAPLELMPGDPIEAEVQKAHEHFDGELEWFFGEWTEGRDGISG